MKKSYRKEVAAHPDPESCGAGRKACHEALTGADAGEVSSREITQSGSPTLLSEAEGHTPTGAKASLSVDPRGPQHVSKLPAQELGDPSALHGVMPGERFFSCVMPTTVCHEHEMGR